MLNLKVINESRFFSNFTVYLLLPNFVFLSVQADLRFERQSSDCYDWNPRQCQQMRPKDCKTFAVQMDCPRTCRMCENLA